MTTSEQPDDSFSYGEALSELESIIAALDDDRLDVDALADRVERASELIARCRERLDATQLRVSRIVEGVETPVE